MRFSQEITLYSGHEHYQFAKQLLKKILRQEIPETSIVETLFPGKSKWILKNLDLAYSTYLQGLANLPIRVHNESAPQSISIARSNMENWEVFMNVQHHLLNMQLPELDLLEKIYGQYASEVSEIFRLFIRYGLMRKCGITSTAHLNRVGGVIYELNFDDNTGYGYPAIGAMHDAIEDLLGVASDKFGEVYDISRYREFLYDLIPETLSSRIMMLTNHYDLILNYIIKKLKSDKLAVNKENLLKEIEIIGSKNFFVISNCAERMHEHLSDFDLGEDILENAKWLCYRRLYLKDLAHHSDMNKDYRPLEIKAIDLSDNSHGKESLPLNSKIKNIIKQERWARRSYELQAKWDFLNQRVEEIMEDAYVAAEHLIIRSFLEKESIQDFFVSALYNIRKLKSIFYIKDKKDTSGFGSIASSKPIIYN